jgi:hypothetical protein
MGKSRGAKLALTTPFNHSTYRAKDKSYQENKTMVCCMAEKYGWCKDIEETIKGPDGKDYCIFHAPEESKPPFNKLKFDRILEKHIEQSGEHLDLSGATLKYNTALQLTSKTKTVNLRGINIQIKLSIQGGKDILLFISTKPESKELELLNITGNSRLTINNSFLTSLEINNSNFDRLYITKIYNIEQLDIYDTESRYLNISKIDEKKCYIYIVNTYISQTLLISEIDITDLSIKILKLGIRGEIRNLSSNNIEISNIITENNLTVTNTGLSNFIYSSSSIDKIDFISCKWPQDNGRNIIPTNIKTEVKGIDKLKLTEDIYRRLKRKARLDNNELLASDWHYGEKRMLEKRLWTEAPALTWFTLWLYRHISDYGESPEKALWVLLSFILAFPILFCFFTHSISLPIDIHDIQTLTNSTLNYIPFASRAPDSDNLYPLRYLEIFWQTVITIQAAITGLAFRNKFRR